MPSKKLYDKWRAANKCGWCGKPANGKSLCPTHMKIAIERHNIWQSENGNPGSKKRYARLKGEGKCVICAEKREDINRVQCNKCRRKYSAYYKARYERMKNGPSA